MRSNNLVTLAHQARTHLHGVNRALAAIDYEPIPGPEQHNLPDIQAPTSEEVLDALSKIKGDPGKSTALQALAVREWAANHPALRDAEHHAWVRAWDHAKTLFPSLIDTIREGYRDEGVRLAEYATGPLSGIENLSTLDLATLPSRTAHHAADAIAHYRRATALHQAWRTLALRAAGMVGAPATLYEMADPTLDQFRAAINAAPQQFPLKDAWSIARKGWKLDLPEKFRGAQERRASLAAQDKAIDDDISTLRMKGEHRAAQRLASISSEQHDVPDAMLS